MKINKDSLSARINNLSQEKGISPQSLYSRFFFDAFLCRISKSKYRNDFVLKGGLLLSSMFGPTNRTTVDIDFLIRSQKLELDNLLFLFNDILSSPKEDDGIEFLMDGYSPIRPEDEYGGYSFRFIGKLENVKVPFSIDVATGDPITPNVKDYQYACLITQESITMKVYPLETVIAEKMETILAKGLLNSRSKDFYDLYFIYKTSLSSLPLETMRQAYLSTCQHRSFAISREKALLLTKEMKESPFLQTRWKAYSRKFTYAAALTWEDVVNVIEKWCQILI
ncbi:MAG: nucleotidyl transferase AbiEii/AbiGii toxin family protein [Bacilli bacterium]|nr:nucleotidyl transferase AbiEii/AbiGii toxin family protein [Bacilli bacterium]